MTEEEKLERLRASKRRSYQKHRAKALEKGRRWRLNNKERHNASIEAWFERGGGKAAYFREWRKKNPELANSYGKRWRAANKDKVRLKTSNRRTRIKGLVGKHTKEDLERIGKLQRGKCAYCRHNLSDKFHIDHIIPLSKGGGGEPSNLQLLCKTCNLRKNAHDPIDYAQSIGLLL